MSDERKILKMESFFMALADKTRLRLLNLMREGELCVCFFVEVLGESQPKVSRHLAYLRNAGIVGARRDGKWIHYKIVFPENDFEAQVLRNTLVWLGSQEKMQSDYGRLAEVCCSFDVAVTISRAPKPNTFVEANVSKNQSQELETFLL